MDPGGLKTYVSYGSGSTTLLSQFFSFKIYDFAPSPPHMYFFKIQLWYMHGMCTVGYSDYDVFLESDKGSLVYRYKK